MRLGWDRDDISQSDKPITDSLDGRAFRHFEFFCDVLVWCLRFSTSLQLGPLFRADLNQRRIKKKMTQTRAVRHNIETNYNDDNIIDTDDNTTPKTIYY